MDNSFPGSSSAVIQKGKFVFVEAQLQGGAPWGFTLKGGLEHDEPLIISKVEEGGKASLLQHPLQVGDEVVIINEVELSGWRQEAISLVKGSYKTLRLTVRRECCPGPCCSGPRPLSPSRDSRCSGGVKLRIKNRRSEPGSRPHSWHSTKLGEGPQDSESMMQVTQGGVGAPWHQSYHSSASTTDLSGFETGFLRKSPDQYSSRGSMESLDHTHPAYSSCYQLSSSKSSSSIDHLHSKRDSAYSSFSTSSSIPEYLAAAPSFNKERSYSMENVPQREGMQQADIRYIRTVYDPQQGVSEEHEITSAALMRTNDSRAQSRSGNVSGMICHRGSSSSGSSGSSGSTTSSQRHSVGTVWDPAQNRHSYENLKGAPAPPLRSDSYAAFRNHERPNSWSSLEHARSQRALNKGSWHHSSGSVATGKSSFGAEGQLHTVIEKSPESSPTTKPKQGCPQAAPGRLMLPTSIYPVPPPEPHFAQIPTSNPNSGSVYPALAKESKQNHHCDHLGGPVKEDRVTFENGYQSNSPSPNPVQTYVSSQPKLSDKVQDDTQVKPVFYRPHLQPQVQKSQTPYVPQERRDPYTPVQPRGERPRFTLGMEVYDNYRPPRDEEQNKCEQNIHPDPLHTGKVAQGQVAQTYRGNFVQTQGSDHLVKPPRHHSDSSALQQRGQDFDHPLTRLENALAEVQRGVSPESTASQCSVQSERSMSVLEKVSHFERQQVKPRSHSSLSYYGSMARPSQTPRPSSAKSSFSGVEDVHNMLERSNSSIPHGRTQSTSSMASYDGHMEAQQDFQTRRGSSDLIQHRQQKEPVVKTCLQRSKSTFQLGEGNGKDIQGKGDIQDILGTIQDTSFNRAYRDSIKDAQSKVLRSTSFRRRDLSVNPPPVPAKHMSLERKGPSTSPKPATTSPHTPKERHVVPVEAPIRTSPPELPSVPAVGPPVIRICGRKRFTMEQKKRSYSEPENMHEVGVMTQEISQAERNVQQQFLASETSVADRRRMFEQVANRNTEPRFFSSRPDLKQMQQDALVEYMERKTGRRVDGRPNRPHSAYLQSASSSADLRSLNSTPSMCSLQEPGHDGFSGGIRKASTLPAGMQSSFYPLRGMQNHTRPESQGTNSESHKPDPTLTRNTLPQHLEAIFERATSARSSGRSASAEDLLDRSEERPIPQHFRSKSSPVENFSQDFLAGEFQMFKVSSKESSENRVLANMGHKQPSCSARTERSYQLNQGPVQQNAPVLRRERQRHSDRPRAISASGLAASVGLPCPFTSPGTSASLDWHNGDRLCQPNLDSIAFPETGPQSPSRALGMVRQNSSDTSTSEDTLKDFPCPVATPSPPHPEVTGSQLARSSDSKPPTLPKSPDSPAKPLLSLRISESNLQDVHSIAVLQDDDEVFLAQLPPPPSPPPPPPPPIRETEITEDFPPPPDVGLMEALQHPGPLQPISDSENLADTSVHPEPVQPSNDHTTPSVTPDPQSTTSSQPQSLRGAPLEEDTSEILGPDYHLLSRRERTHGELLVETLARELVSHDKSLTLLLDTWAGKTTLDLMEDIFPSHSTSPHRRSSSHSGHSAQDDQCAPDTPSQAVPRKMETNLDDDEAYLNQKKGELLQALHACIRSLQGEREGLLEQQKRFGALGGSMEALVQECCKPNEREKYRMFVGDLEKIVNLLLSLSARLARVENTLSSLDDDDESVEEKESLQLKRKQLCSQQEDARELKENLDRRERVVQDILASYLSRPQLHDYQRYIRIKPALLIRQRHLDELIRQGEEQVRRLEETLPPEYHPKHTDPTPQTQPCFNSTHLSRPTTVTSL
ncbi:protein Shroom3 isoform X2 [Ctenopharyngodon idella]|uniref:protein Shroom3 isoform X2 n=1 Tax=Ctenopharyngodon idella TaxID=7959 RepID=UPI002231DEF4|nr:protein Shroom3 isoform X2 [Ctenopharyngodon idella]